MAFSSGHLPAALAGGEALLCCAGESTVRRVQEEAVAFLRSLTPEQRRVATFGIDSPDRLDWHYIPGEGVEKRQVEGKLWELKPDQHRLIYVMVAGPTLVVVHGCKKQGGKARKVDLDVARKRMSQVLDQERQRKKK
jgi:phage-related protein